MSRPERQTTSPGAVAQWSEQGTHNPSGNWKRRSRSGPNRTFPQMSVGVAGSNRKQPEPGATERTRAKTRAGLGARGRGSGHPVAWGLDTTSLRRGPPSVVDIQVTRGFRWGISMSRSGESYVSVVTGAELRGRTSERPPEAAPERLGAHRARCGSRRSIRAVLRWIVRPDHPEYGAHVLARPGRTRVGYPSASIRPS